MADHTVSGVPFAAGATVSVFLRGTQSPSDRPDVPGAALVTTGTVAVDASVDFTGLTAGAKYWAIGLVDGSYRWISFQVEDDPVLGGDAHSSATTNVHGIQDTSLLVRDDDPRLSDSRPVSSHTHPQTDVDGLTADLAAKADQADLDTAEADISALQTNVAAADAAAAAAQADADAAAAAQTAHAAGTAGVHGIADTTQLATQTDLAGYATLDQVQDMLAGLQFATQQDIDDAIDAHASLTAGVHGFPDPPPPGGGIPAFGSMAGYGHSYPAGTSLAPSERFLNQLADELGLAASFTNHAANSTCISVTNSTPPNGIQNYMTSLWMMRTFRPSLGGLIDAANRTGLHVLLTLLNDLGALGGTVPPTSNEIDQTVRAMETWIARLLANDFFEDNHSSHTYGVNWAQNSATYTSGTTNRGASVTPGLIEIVVPSGFPGGDIFLQFMGAGSTAAVRGATHTIYLDTVLHGTHDSRGDTSGRNTHSVYWLKNVAAGARFIQIVTGAPATSTFYDGWGFIKSDSPAVVEVVKTPRLTAAGLTAHSNQYTNSHIDLANQAVDTMKARCPTGRVIVASSHLATMNENPAYFRTAEGDPLHPNPAGNVLFKQACVDALEAEYA